MVVHAEYPDPRPFAHFSISLSTLGGSARAIRGFGFGNQPQRPFDGETWKTTWPGTESSTSVPAEGPLMTFNFAPILSALSRIPESPQCPSRPDRSTSGFIPQPLSRTKTFIRFDAYSSSTSMLLAPEWRNALTSASRPML